MVYLWRAVDAEGEVLDVLVQSKRNKHDALDQVIEITTVSSNPETGSVCLDGMVAHAV
jgi:transposase-like protein